MIAIFAFTCLQATPPTTQCGILYTYDAAGNRIKQEYYCKVVGSANPTNTGNANDNTSFSVVSAMYPNPTTGKVYISFSMQMTNAAVVINDMSGRVVKTFTGNGQKLEVDLSGYAAGMYVITINDGKNVFSGKIIKQ